MDKGTPNSWLSDQTTELSPLRAKTTNSHHGLLLSSRLPPGQVSVAVMSGCFVGIQFFQVCESNGFFVHTAHRTKHCCSASKIDGLLVWLVMKLTRCCCGSLTPWCRQSVVGSTRKQAARSYPCLSLPLDAVHCRNIRSASSSVYLARNAYVVCRLQQASYICLCFFFPTQPRQQQ